MSDPRTGGVTQEPRKTKKNGVKNLKGVTAIPDFQKVKKCYLENSINWRKFNFLNYPEDIKKSEFYYMPDMKQDRKTVKFGMNIAIYLLERWKCI